MASGPHVDRQSAPRGWLSTRTRFGSLAVLLHWLMLVLIVAAYATMEFKGLTPRGSPERATLAAWHYGFGLSVFALAWLRLAVRALGHEPQVVPPPTHWEAELARIGHFLLYAFMIVTPTLGWLTVSAQGAAVLFFGIPLPLLIAKSEPLRRQLQEVHETIANIGYAFIGVHAAAALFHHYIRRDNTLSLMWPRSW